MSVTHKKAPTEVPSFGPDDFDRMWNGNGGQNDDNYSGEGSNQAERTPPPEGYRIGTRLVLISITVLFLALSSAYVANRAQLQPIATPPALYYSTALLLISSITIELARRAIKRRLNSKFKLWISLTMVLGLMFLSSQLIAWRQLIANGFYLTSNIHSSYAYIFTTMHATHLIGGLIALAYVALKPLLGWTTVRRRVVVDSVALYWHFLDGLWVYLLSIIFLWK